jgi:hypothetical protein
MQPCLVGLSAFVSAPVIAATPPALAPVPQARLEQEKQRARAARFAAADQRSSRVARGAARAWLRARYALSDHVRTALILGVFGFKVSAGTNGAGRVLRGRAARSVAARLDCLLMRLKSNCPAALWARLW